MADGKQHGDALASPNSSVFFSSTWRSAPIPRQYASFSYVYDVNANGDYVPNTTQRTEFGFGIDSIATTALGDIGYNLGAAPLGTLAQFNPAVGIDASILTSVQSKGGNFSGDPAVASLLLGFSIILRNAPRHHAVAGVLTDNRQVPYGGTDSLVLTQLVAREEQLFRNMIRNLACLAIPDGNNQACGARCGISLLNPSGAGMADVAVAQNIRFQRYRLRTGLCYPGSDDPNVNYNRLQLLFGSVPAANGAGLQYTVSRAPGDAVLLLNSSVVLDCLCVADVALVDPKPQMTRITDERGTVIKESMGYVGITDQDQELINFYACQK